MIRRLLLLALLLLGTGCVYYNGMYNTKRFAGRARKAEREGRTFDAANFWGQVSVKAESLLAKHPTSKYAEEARLLHGTARARLNDCSTALPELEQVMLSSTRPQFAEAAAEEVGACRVKLGDNAGAAQAYARITTSSQPSRRDLALYAHGQALRLGGNHQEALNELAQTRHPRARGERAAALAGLGQIESALAVAESLIIARDTLAPWPAIAANVATHDPAAASRLAERFAADTNWPSRIRGRLLIDDGLRLADRDPVLSTARLEMAAEVGGISEAPIEAQLILIRRRLATMETVDSLRQAANDLSALGEGAASFTQAILRLTGSVNRAALAADSVPPGAPQGDLRLFLAGELARDSAEAPRFAAVQFRRVAAEWPDSPFAPKALLALIMLEPVAADTLRERIRSSYPASPYLLLVDGHDTPALAQLEDSLRTFAQNFQPDRPAGTPARRPGSQPNRRPTTEPLQ